MSEKSNKTVNYLAHMDNIEM